MARILAVDSNRSVLFDLERGLKGYGHEVRTLSDAAEVFKQCQEFQPDVLFIDLDPAYDVFTALTWLRRRHANTAIVAMTSHSDPVVNHHSVRSGASGYIMKPLNLAETAELVENIVKPTAATHRKSREIGHFWNFAPSALQAQPI